MQKNLLLAVVISMALVTFWDIFVMRRLAPPPTRGAQTYQGQAPLPAETGAAPNFSPALETIPARSAAHVFLKNDNNLITFSSDGAAVESWQIKANGDWIEMALKSSGRAAFSTFDGVPYQGRAQDGEVLFDGRLSSGVLVKKTFQLGPRFLHRFQIELTNPTGAPVDLQLPLGWCAGLGTDDRALADNLRDCRVIAYDGRRAMKLSAGPHTDQPLWFGNDNKYFLAAFIPEVPVVSTLNVDTPRKQLPILEDDVPLSLKPGERRTLAYQFYLGPKAFSEFLDPRLNLKASENYGFFDNIGKYLKRGLSAIYRVTGNYGWAIIILTIFLQCLLLPLTMHSYKHGVRMRELQPQIKVLQERFKGDPKRMNVEVMNLYQRNGLKFMGMEGCFPMLLQIPFFYAFYSVLRNSYELRGAPWLGWIKDLSVKDPYYVLPILMAGGMIAQQKIGGAVSTDPAQAQMMMLMPLVLSFVFARLPSGYLLYWITNSLATLAIQGWMRWRDSQKAAAR